MRPFIMPGLSDDPPPAIIQPANMWAAQFKIEARDCLQTIDKKLSRLLELSECFNARWREFGATKELACMEAFGCSRDTFRKKISYWRDATSGRNLLFQDQDESTETNLPPASHINEPPKPKPSAVPATTVGTQAGPSPAQPVVAKEPAPTEPQPPEDNHKPEPKPPTDLSGAVIPQELLSLFERKEEVTKMEHYASKLHAFLEQVQKDQDPLWASLRHSATLQTFTASAQSMQWAIRDCRPEVVCPVCSGSGKAAGNGQWCHECDGTKTICEVRWNRDWVKSSDKTKRAIVEARSHA